MRKIDGLPYYTPTEIASMFGQNLWPGDRNSLKLKKYHMNQCTINIFYRLSYGKRFMEAITNNRQAIWWNYRYILEKHCKV